MAFFIFSLIMTGGVGCHRTTDRTDYISIRQDIQPLPAQVGSEATVGVQIADATANPVTGATIMVEANMTHPGMAPIFIRASERRPGSYQAKVTFAMGGDWELLLHIKLANGNKIERQMDVRGVRSN
jgi:hypothetical protein